MTKIKKYDLDQDITGEEKLLMTDGDTSRTTKNISVEDFSNYLLAGVVPSSFPPVENTYGNLSEMYADQANQTEGFLQYVFTGNSFYQYKGTTAGNLTDYIKLSSTGLEAINEGNGIGWRLIGRDPANYGNIGKDSVDFSVSDNPSTTLGPTLENGLAGGFEVESSGYGISWGYDITSNFGSSFKFFQYNFGRELTSRGFCALNFGLRNENNGHSSGVNYNTVLGRNVISTATNGLQAGRRLTADAICLTVLGSGNATKGNNNNSTSSQQRITGQPIFVVGIGDYEDGSTNDKDLCVGYWDGNFKFPELTNGLIDAAGNDSAVTKGWVEDKNNKTEVYTFATLPAAPVQGQRAAITDASTVSFRAPALGGGADFSPVIYDGSQWIYA